MTDNNKHENKAEELCEEKRELTPEELEQVNGGHAQILDLGPIADKTLR